MTFPEDTKEELAREDVKEWQTRALKAEAALEGREYGFANSHFTVYGTKPAIKQLAEWYAELMEFRRIAAKEEELRAAKAKIDWFERRQVLFDKLTETVGANPSNPSYLHAILEGLRLWEAENPKP